MKSEIEKGLQIANDFADLGKKCQEFSLRLKKLTVSFSEKEIEVLTKVFWEELVPKNYLLTKETADELMEIAPVLAELVEANNLIKLLTDAKV